MAAPARWAYPAEQPFRTIEHQWIPMHDGVRLSARLWLPQTAARVPAVLEYIPYRKRDRYRPYDDLWGATLAAAGIAFVRVDVRGSGESEGVMTDEYSEAELADGEAIIAWIAAQTWCSGAVGMRGLSWGGINTLQVAARRPKALKAIMAMGCCDRRFTDDAHYIGGVLGRTNFQWGVLFKTVMAAPPDPAIVGEAWREMWRARLEATPPILATWLSHQTEDAYWRRGSVGFDPSRIEAPAYLVSGWSDTYSEPVLRLMSTLKSPRKALIGPWGHTYPYTARPLGLDWKHEEVRWWRHWLMGEATGLMDEPRLRVFMPYMTASEAGARPIPGRWIAERAWPAPAPAPAAGHVLHLNEGELGEQARPGPQLTVRDRGVVGTTKPEWLDRLPIDQSTDDRQSLGFLGAPLSAPLEMFGSPALDLRFTPRTPWPQLAIRLCEVRPDGQSWLVTWGVLDLANRKGMQSRRPMRPASRARVKLKLRAIAHRFSAGSRIGLFITPSLWPMLWPSAYRTELSLPAGASTLTLPVRVSDSPEDFPVPELRRAAEAPSVYSPIAPDADGRVALVQSTPPAPYAPAGIETELSHSQDETCEITAGDPLSCRWRENVRSSWRRPGWECAVEASYELTADQLDFHIVETVRAFESGQQVFERTHDQRIPRVSIA